MIERRPDGKGAVPQTDASGTATEESVTPGVHRCTVGQAFDDPDEGCSGQQTSDDFLLATVTVDVAAGRAPGTGRSPAPLRRSATREADGGRL